MTSVVTATSVAGVQPIARGKVRDVYAAGANELLFVATDRISAFDCILPNGIPRKGEVLTQMSIFWFEFLQDVIPSHFLTANVADFPAPFRDDPAQFAGRSMLVKRAEMIPVECVARGYLAGSGWKEYRQHGSVCGIPLPAGLQDGSQLPEPLFTPATKAASGHDENVSIEEAARTIGMDLAIRLRDVTLAIYGKAAEYARARGIILADTKFEFGMIDGVLTLGDEVLTPDSSRFWPAATWRPGGAQPSFDKQFVRDWLETTDWQKQPPAPELPSEVVNKTSEKYLEAYHLLTGKRI